MQHKPPYSRKTWRGTWLLFFSFSALLFEESALAMTVVERPFSDLVHRAEIIAVGTVTEVRPQWDVAKQVPLTAVTFSDVTVLKGHVHPTPLTLYFLGGPTPQGTHLLIPGMPSFIAGEKTVVFSIGNQRNICPLVGIWQGRLRVVLDPQRQVETVRDNFHVPIVGLKGGRFLKKRLSPSATKEALSLPALIQLIQHELQRSNGQP